MYVHITFGWKFSNISQQNLGWSPFNWHAALWKQSVQKFFCLKAVISYQIYHIDHNASNMIGLPFWHFHDHTWNLDEPIQSLSPCKHSCHQEERFELPGHDVLSAKMRSHFEYDLTYQIRTLAIMPFWKTNKWHVHLPLSIQGKPCQQRFVWQTTQGHMFPAFEHSPVRDDTYREFLGFFSDNPASHRVPSIPWPVLD